MERFKDRKIAFDNGCVGINVDVPSASPVNYYQALTNPGQMPTIIIDGKLFLPTHPVGPLPTIIVAPGSLGVADSHLRHAEAITNLGFAAFVVDSFGERSVTSTVADQTQFSFAASAYDILRCVEVLAEMPEVDATRIGAQGHSRGGSAVMTAANRTFASAIVGEGPDLAAVLAAYPWCGHQFLNPDTGQTKVRVLMGDRDEWCSPMQAQAQCHAIGLAGGDIEMTLFGNAQHGFDRGSEIEKVPDARVAPAAPIVYIADDGAMIHPLSSAPEPQLMDRDLMVYAIKAGYGVVGANLGSNEGDADQFNLAMTQFWRNTFARSPNQK